MSSGAHIGISNGTAGSQGSLMQMISEHQAIENEKYIASIRNGVIKPTSYNTQYTQLGSTLFDKEVVNGSKREYKSANSDLIKELIFVKLLEDFNGISAGTLGIVINKCDGTAFKVKFIDSYGKTIDVVTVPVNLLCFVTK